MKTSRKTNTKNDRALWLIAIMMLALALCGCQKAVDGAVDKVFGAVEDEMGGWLESVEQSSLEESREEVRRESQLAAEESLRQESEEAARQEAAETSAETSQEAVIETTEEYVPRLRKLELKTTKISAVGWVLDFARGVKNLIDTDKMPSNIQLAFADEYANQYGYVKITEDMVQDGKAVIPLKVVKGSQDNWYLEIEIFDLNTAPEWYWWSMSTLEDPDWEGEMDRFLAAYLTPERQLGTDAFWDALADATRVNCGFENDPRSIYAGLERAAQLDLDIQGKWNDTATNRNAMYAVCIGLSRLPVHVLEHYRDHGGAFYLVKEELTQGHEDVDTIGQYHSKDRSIHLTSVYGKTTYFELVTIHEMGHYVDDSNNKISATSAWKKCYQAAKEKVGTKYGQVLEEGTSIESVIKVKTKNLGNMYREYSFYSEQEFFADSFALYVICPERFQRLYPEVYAIIDDCVNNLQ